jgi:hypothetical protein
VVFPFHLNAIPGGEYVGTLDYIRKARQELNQILGAQIRIILIKKSKDNVLSAVNM